MTGAAPAVAELAAVWAGAARVVVLTGQGRDVERDLGRDAERSARGARRPRPWKAATVPFGQPLPAADLERAFRAAGARVAIVTASATPFDALATWRVGEPVERVLPALPDRVLAARVTRAGDR